MPPIIIFAIIAILLIAITYYVILITGDKKSEPQQQTQTQTQTTTTPTGTNTTVTTGSSTITSGSPIDAIITDSPTRNPEPEITTSGATTPSTLDHQDIIDAITAPIGLVGEPVENTTSIPTTTISSPNVPTTTNTMTTPIKTPVTTSPNVPTTTNTMTTPIKTPVTTTQPTSSLNLVTGTTSTPVAGTSMSGPINTSSTSGSNTPVATVFTIPYINSSTSTTTSTPTVNVSSASSTPVVNVSSAISTTASSSSSSSSTAKPTQYWRSDGKCGPSYGNAPCKPGQCCSQWGFCGTTSKHCVKPSCVYQCNDTTIKSPRSDGRCGPSYGNAPCKTNQCCSRWGFCGKTDKHCIQPNCVYQCKK